HEIDVNDAAVDVERGFDGERALRDAGVIDQTMNAAVRRGPGRGLLDDPGETRKVRSLERQDEAASLAALRRLCERGLVAAGENEPCTLGRHRLGERRAYAGRRAGDPPNLVLEHEGPARNLAVSIAARRRDPSRER